VDTILPLEIGGTEYIAFLYIPFPFLQSVLMERRKIK